MRELAAIVALGLATSAMAQDAADWDLRETPASSLTVAYTTYDSGISLAVRCLNGNLEGLISGLPAATGDLRDIEIAFGDDALRVESWYVGLRPTIAVTALPAPFARKLRQGGQFQVRVADPAQGNRKMRYVIDLPASNAAIDRALTACDRPLVDHRDGELSALASNGLPTQLTWARRPEPRYPSSRVYEKGFANLT